MKKKSVLFLFQSRNCDNDNAEVTITVKSRFCFIARIHDSSKSENTPPNRLSHSYKNMGLAGLLTQTHVPVTPHVKIVGWHVCMYTNAQL